MLTGLYAITPLMADTAALCSQVDEALAGGANVVQYRFKSLPDDTAMAQASQLLVLCRRYGKPLIINDSVDLMLAVGADGVHVGRDDADPGQVRARIGVSPILGVSCYDRIELAQPLQGIADYVAFGSVFASRVKPDAVRAPLGLFSQARALGFNTVAIGGIDLDNVAQVKAAGADAVAVISALFDSRSIVQRAREFSATYAAV